MKRIFMASAAALCIAIGVSAHKPYEPVHHSLKAKAWFKILVAIAKAVLPILFNSEVQHPPVSKGITPPPVGSSGCSSSGTHLCLAGFTTAQLTAGGNYLKTIFGPQLAVSSAYTRV